MRGSECGDLAVIGRNIRSLIPLSLFCHTSATRAVTPFSVHFPFAYVSFYSLWIRGIMETSGNSDQKDALRSIGLVQPPIISGSGQSMEGGYSTYYFFIGSTMLAQGLSRPKKSLVESREPDVNSANFIPENSAHILQYSVESMK